MFNLQMQAHLQTLTDELVALDKRSWSLQRMETCVRAARALRAAACIRGVQVGAELAHAMEMCFITARDYKLALTPEQVCLMIRGLDVLGRLAEPSRSSGSVSTA